MDVVSPALLAIACKQLSSGERLLWVGAPTGTDLFLQYLPISLFGIFFFAFVVLLLRKKRVEWVAANVIFAGIFLSAGIFLIVMAPLAAALQPHAESYAITDRRALITRIPPFDSEAYGPSEMDVPTVVAHGDGRSEILFHTDRSRNKSGDLAVTQEGFRFVPHASDVARLIAQVRAGQPLSELSTSHFAAPVGGALDCGAI